MSWSSGGFGEEGCDSGSEQPAKQPSPGASGCCGKIKVQGTCITCHPACGCGCQQPVTQPCLEKCDGCGTSKVKGKCIACLPTCDCGCQQPATPPSPPPPRPPSPPPTPPPPSPSPPPTPPPPSPSPPPTPPPPKKKRQRQRRPPPLSITESVPVDVVSSPPWQKAIIPGSQHYVMMIGTALTISNVVVPRMGGGDVEKAEVINTFLFVAGFNTLFQTLFGARLPVVMGSSFSFIVPTLYIASSRRFLKYTDQNQKFKHTMRAVQGAQIISSIFQTALGYSGLWKKYVRSLSPLAAVPLVTHTGLGLFARGFPELAQCVEVGLPELIIAIVLCQYVPSMLTGSRRNLLKQVAITLSIVIVWVYAAILTAAGAYDNRPEKTQTSCRTDRSGLINATPWTRIPHPFQWGRPTFDAGDALAMMAASFVSTVESTGTYITASRYGGATPMPPSVHSRALVWQGIGSLLHSIFGTGSGNSASVESAGLLGLTGFASRRVTEVSAVLMILFSVLGKPGALLASVPQPITAALNCINYGYAASSGLGLLQYCNLTTNRTKFILGFALFMGLSVPQYFNAFQSVPDQGPVHTDSIWFNKTLQVIFSSPATVAAMVASFLDSTLERRVICSRKDNGWPWWEKFKKFKSDPRSKKFYSLPLVDLNRINWFLKWKNLLKCLARLFRCYNTRCPSEDMDDGGNGFVDTNDIGDTDDIGPNGNGGSEDDDTCGNLSESE